MLKLLGTILIFNWILISGIARSQSTSEMVKNYNDTASNIQLCFNRAVDLTDKKILKNIIETHKINKLPPITTDKGGYFLSGEGYKIQFNEASTQLNQFIYNGFQVKLPENYSVQTIKTSLEKIGPRTTVTDQSTLYVFCLLGSKNHIDASDTTAAKQFDEKIKDYNQNVQNPQIFSEKMENPEDKKFYNQLLQSSNTQKLPPIVKKGNLYQMEHNGITLEFDQQMIKEGKIRINKKIVDLSEASNVQEITETIQKALKD